MFFRESFLTLSRIVQYEYPLPLHHRPHHGQLINRNPRRVSYCVLLSTYHGCSLFFFLRTSNFTRTKNAIGFLSFPVLVNIC